MGQSLALLGEGLNKRIRCVCEGDSERLALAGEFTSEIFCRDRQTVGEMRILFADRFDQMRTRLFKIVGQQRALRGQVSQQGI